MCVEHRNLMWGLMLLFLSGALCRQYEVEYVQKHICAVKGSSVVIPCIFYYPDNRRVKRVMWGHDKYHIYDGPFIFDSEGINTSRFQYLGDKKHNCSFKIHQVERDDAGKYAFRFITDGDKWTGGEGSTLKVADLNVSVTKPNGNRVTKEGDSVKLTCINGCGGGSISSVLAWFKNGKPLHEGPVLHLTSMSPTNSGNYTCSLKTHTGTTSPVINIDVEYGPKNTSASASPSLEVDVGSNITLICSSHANPPVEDYTWFKKDNDHVLDVGDQPVFFTGERGQYFCRATNRHGSQNSSVVTVKAKENGSTFEKGATFYKHLLITLTVAALLIVTSVIAIRRLNKKSNRAPQADCEEDIQNADYVNWPVVDNNQSQERSQCEGATVDLIYATVEFHTKRKSNMEQQNDSHHDDECVIYSTVCRNQMCDPSYIETL